MPRRGENIRKRKDGRWEGRYAKGQDSAGKTKYGSVYAKTYSEVKQKLTEKNNCIKTNTLSQNKGDLFFEDLLYLWLDNIKIKIKEQTYEKYKRLIETHIIPDLGQLKIRQINTTLLNQYLYQKSITGRLDKSGGLSTSYIQTISVIIKSAIKYAAYEKIYIFEPLDISTPKQKPKETEVLTKKEQAALEEYLLNHFDEKAIGIFLSLYTGLRIGEVCGLKWGDIDFNTRSIHVRNTVIRIANPNPTEKRKTTLVLGDTKTRSSKRIIPMPELIYIMLKNLAQSSNMFVIKGCSYPYTDPRTYQYVFHKYLENSGVRNVNYHVLRHTFATRCMESGMDMKSLSEILGHSNVNITLNIYVHSSMELKRAQMEKMISFCGQK